MSDFLLQLFRANLAAAVAVALVMALRPPARRLFGARIAYRLWIMVPLAALAMLAPARTVTLAVPASPAPAQVAPLASPVEAPATVIDPWPLLAAIWLAGGALSLAWLVRRQVQFGHAMRARRAGPAVVGVLRPRVVTPEDFAARYTPREQQVVLAHERTHIARHDSRINAVVALARCANWFNPAVHLLAHYLRIDQEFACDAQVVAAHPTARRSYAEAMLKTQLAARPLPLGCYWPAQAAHPLAQRIRLLSDATPGPARAGLGACAVAALGLAGGWSAWAARPAEVVLVPEATSDVAPSPAPENSPTAIRRAEAPRPPPAKAAPPPAPRGGPAPVEFAWRSSEAVPEPQPVPQPQPQPGPDAPLRKVHAVARRSAVEPGSAVRVVATMVDNDGAPVTVDLTAYGSQSAYRTGYYTRPGRLFTAVRQQRDRLWVTASLDRSFRPETTGTVALASGQTGQIALGDGHVVTVTPTIRPETPDEVAEGQALNAEWEARLRDRDERRAARGSAAPG